MSRQTWSSGGAAVPDPRVAPLGAAGLPRDEWLAGRTQGYVDEFTWSLAGANTLVPPAHRRRLARHVRGALVVTMSGGHLELVNRTEELVVWLIGGRAPKDASVGVA
ncbi:MAG: hypothetical protein LH645_09650 [Actinomycetia bacterium]|nr:hypothetical protein [Actinomycetes bacterium]